MNKLAFVFPGQGSQTLGMLDGFSDNEVVAQTIAEASEILKQDFAKLIAKGPREQIDLTTNTQPLMLMTSVAFYRAWLAAKGKIPDLVAGHSLGEYSALVVAGVIAFEDALPLVRYRAQLMQEAVPIGKGAMAAILGLSDDDVRAICMEVSQTEIVEPVNFNAPAQIVIAGHADAVFRACDLAKSRGAKRAVILPVSAPFHSSLMKSASQKLMQYMVFLSFTPPKIELINNVDVAIENTPDAIKSALERQAASPVRWVETINCISAMGFAHIIECGPGKVLSGLTKRINPSLRSDAIFDQASLERVLAQ